MLIHDNFFNAGVGTSLGGLSCTCDIPCDSGRFFAFDSIVIDILVGESFCFLGRKTCFWR
jgi:hypothetical protein